MKPRLRRRIGIGMIVCGLAIIVASVLVVLELADGERTGPMTFANRRSYNQVKESVQRSFPIALLTGLCGLGLAMAGSRLAHRTDTSGEPS